MGVIAQEIWDVIMEPEKDGRRLVKDEAKNDSLALAELLFSLESLWDLCCLVTGFSNL